MKDEIRLWATAVPWVLEQDYVESLPNNPESHSHKLITVRGCYVPERSTLQPCDRNKRNQVVWVQRTDARFKFSRTGRI